MSAAVIKKRGSKSHHSPHAVQRVTRACVPAMTENCWRPPPATGQKVMAVVLPALCRNQPASRSSARESPPRARGGGNGRERGRRNAAGLSAPGRVLSLECFPRVGVLGTWVALGLVERFVQAGEVLVGEAL